MLRKEDKPAFQPKLDLTIDVASTRHPEDRDGLIAGLLNGFEENDSLCYWEDRSPEEIRAREALADLLLSEEPLDRRWRSRLAALIAPRGTESQIIKRRIRFEYIEAGTPADNLRKSRICEAVYFAVAKGDSVNAAVKKVAEEWNLGPRQVMEIWRQNRANAEFAHGVLPRSHRRKKPVP